MKNNDNLLADFFAFPAMVGIMAAFSEMEKTEKPQAEKDTTEKQCKCTGNNCKNQQDFNKKLFDIREDIAKCRTLAFSTCRDDNVTLFQTLCDIEQKLFSIVE